MRVMIDGVPRPKVRTRWQQSMHEAAPILWYLGFCVLAVSIPVLLRFLAFFPE